MAVRRALRFLAALGLVGASLTSCSLGGSHANLVGSVGSTYARASAKASAPLSVDQVCAFPAQKTDGSWPGVDMMKLAQTVPINSDGTFSISFGSSDYTWIFLLLNSSAPTPAEKIVGFVSLNDGGDTMMAFPTGSVNDDVDCGALTQKGDEAVSSNSLTTQSGSFTLSLDGLQQIARADNVLKAVKNNYVNYNEATGIAYNLIPRYNWSLHRADIKGSFSNPMTNASVFKGFYPQIGSNDDAIRLADLVSGATTLALYPPSTIDLTSQGGSVYGPSAPLSSTGTVYTQNTPGADIVVSGNDFGGINFNVDSGETRCDAFWFKPQTAGYFTGSCDGIWTLKKNGAAIGQFDLSLGSPANAAGKCVLYFPSVKATVNASGYITGVDVQFYGYDAASGTYQLVTDLAGMNAILGSYMLGITGAGVSEYLYPSISDPQGMAYSFSGFTHQILFDTASIQIAYNVAGVNINFWWEN